MRPNLPALKDAHHKIFYFTKDLKINGVTIGRGPGNISLNTVVGASALSNNTTGTNNTAFGYAAGNTITSGSYNTFIGYNARGSAGTNIYELAIGHAALGLGSNTTVIGTNGATNSTTIYGALSLPDTTASTSTITGALKVAGGAGIAGTLTANNVRAAGVYGDVYLTPYSSVFAQGNASQANVILQASANNLAYGIGLYASTGAINSLYSSGDIYFVTGRTVKNQDIPTGGNTYMSLNTSGVLTLSATTSSTDTLTGALQVAGGVGIVENLFVGGTINTSTTAVSAAAWTTSGVNLKLLARTYTDTSSTAGTVSSSYINTISAPTFASTNAITIANAANLFVDAPVAGTNSTLTNAWAIYANGKIRASDFTGTIGMTTASSGAFTTLSASSTVSGTGFSTYLASPPAIGSTTASTGIFTQLTVNGANLNTSISPTGTSTVTISPSTTGSIDNMTIGATTPAAGTFTTLTLSDLTVNGNLSVNGTTTTINSSTVSVDDKNIELGALTQTTGLQATLATGTALVTLTAGSTAGIGVGQTLTFVSGTGAFGASATVLSIQTATKFTASINHATAGAITFSAGVAASDTTANGAGITVKATADKTLYWTSAENRWTSNIGFQANNTALGSTLGNQEIAARFFSTYGSNGGGIDISHFRDAAGSDWTTAGTRIQQKIDSTWMAWQQFNGTGTSQGIAWGTGNSTASAQAVPEAMRLDLNGNLGIGHTTPSSWYSNSARLVVNQAQNAETILGIGNTTVGASASTALRMIGGTANSYSIDRLNDANGSPWMQHDLGSGVLYRNWSMGGTEKLRLNTTGFYVYNSAMETRAVNTSTRIRSINSSSEATRYPGFEAFHYSGNLAGTLDNGGFPVLEFFRSRGTEATKIAVSSGDYIAGIVGWGWDSTGFNDVARINFHADNAFSAADSRGRIEFQTQTGTTLSTRLTIDSSGIVGVGTGSIVASSAPSIQLQSGVVVSSVTGAQITLGSNIVYNSAWKYATTASAAYYQLFNGAHYWNTAPSGTAGTTATFTESMRIDASGNIGIGGIAPLAKLHVKTASAVAGEQVIFENGTNVAYSTLYMILKANGVARAALAGQQDGTSSGGIFVLQVADSAGTSQERLRVTASGNVLIAGTTDDAVSKLQVSGGIKATSIGVANISATTGLGISLYNGPATSSMATFGLAFAGTPTYGTHGAVTGDWATYFTVDNTANRGWIFKNTNTGTSGNVVSISNTGVITATSYATSSGSLVVDWKNLTAQYALQGGGTVTTTTTNILWSARVIAIPVEMSEESSSGYFDISCPTSGTVVYYNPGNVTTTTTCTSNGIPLLAWEALYYQITEGQSSTSDQTKFRVVSYQNSTWVPGPGWICIAARNGDDSSFKWLPGQVNIPQSQYYVSSTGAKSWIAGASTTTTGTGAVVLSATPTLTGNMKIDSVQASGMGVIGQYDAVYGSVSTWYNAGFRNDGANVYLLSSDVQTTQALAKAASWNGYRPLSWNLSTGILSLCSSGQSISIAGGTGSSQVNIASANNYGGTGYAGFFTLTNTTAGATNPNKYIRLNTAGGLEVVNSAYNAVIFTLTNSGQLNVPQLLTTSITTGADATTGTIQGTWSLSGASKLQATYADLAEYYTSDNEYEPGTVLVFGGEEEVTVSQTYTDRKLAGVVSESAAYIMNTDCPGIKVCIALQGRVLVKVIGPVEKGDFLVTSDIPGYAIVNNDPKVGTVIGKSLVNDNSVEKRLIEVAIGRD